MAAIFISPPSNIASRCGTGQDNLKVARQNYPVLLKILLPQGKFTVTHQAELGKVTVLKTTALRILQQINVPGQPSLSSGNKREGPRTAAVLHRPLLNPEPLLF